MAALLRLFLALALALATAVLASPHASRNVYARPHRAIAPVPLPDVHVDSPSLPPRRKRSLNKRCVSRPANATTHATAPATTAPVNVAPLPSSTPSAPSSAPPSYSPAPSTPTPSPTPTSSSPSPAQTSSSSGNGNEPSYLNGPQSGRGTWYSTGLGACGVTNNDNNIIIAVSEDLFDTYPGYDGVNPNTNPVCGRQVSITCMGITVVSTVEDRCTGCNVTSIDMSPSLFQQFAPLSEGVLAVTWEFI